MSIETKKIISLADYYNKHHDGDDYEYYAIYIDDGKEIACPDYYRKFSESVLEMIHESAFMENNHDEFGYPDMETIDKINEISNKVSEYIEELRNIAINSMAEELMQTYDVVEISDKGVKEQLNDKEFGDLFKSATNQGLFIVKLQENAEKYNKKLILH